MNTPCGILEKRMYSFSKKEKRMDKIYLPVDHCTHWLQYQQGQMYAKSHPNIHAVLNVLINLNIEKTLIKPSV